MSLTPAQILVSSDWPTEKVHVQYLGRFNCWQCLPLEMGSDPLSKCNSLRLASKSSCQRNPPSPKWDPLGGSYEGAYVYQKQPHVGYRYKNLVARTLVNRVFKMQIFSPPEPYLAFFAQIQWS